MRSKLDTFNGLYNVFARSNVILLKSTSRKEMRERLNELKPFIAGLHCHAIQIWIRNHSMKEVQNFKSYQRLINKHFLQVSGLCSAAFLSYLPNRCTQIYRAQSGRISKKTPVIHFCYESDYFSLVS